MRWSTRSWDESSCTWTSALYVLRRRVSASRLRRLRSAMGRGGKTRLRESTEGRWVGSDPGWCRREVRWLPIAIGFAGSTGVREQSQQREREEEQGWSRSRDMVTTDIWNISSSEQLSLIDADAAAVDPQCPHQPRQTRFRSAWTAHAQAPSSCRFGTSVSRAARTSTSFHLTSRHEQAH